MEALLYDAKQALNAIGHGHRVATSDPHTVYSLPADGPVSILLKLLVKEPRKPRNIMS